MCYNTAERDNAPFIKCLNWTLLIFVLKENETTDKSDSSEDYTATITNTTNSKKQDLKSPKLAKKPFKRNTNLSKKTVVKQKPSLTGKEADSDTIPSNILHSCKHFRRFHESYENLQIISLHKNEVFH